MDHQTGETPRFEVQELGPLDFVVYDTVTGLSYDPRFTSRAAQEAADRRNAADRTA
ncbi:hypothetical protein [Streptomyces sp. NPDC001658]